MARTVTIMRKRFQSAHVAKAVALARAKGGWAGMRSVADLWSLPKRELVEVALRLGALNTEYGDSVSAGRAAVLKELTCLRENAII